MKPKSNEKGGTAQRWVQTPMLAFPVDPMDAQGLLQMSVGPLPRVRAPAEFIRVSDEAKLGRPLSEAKKQKRTAWRDGGVQTPMLAFDVDPMDAQGPQQMLVGPLPRVRAPAESNTRIRQS